jgi:hypothetical protein
MTVGTRGAAMTTTELPVVLRPRAAAAAAAQ